MKTITINFKGLPIELCVYTDVDPNTGPFFENQGVLPNDNISRVVADWLDENFSDEIDALINKKLGGAA